MYKELHGRLGDRNQKVSLSATVCLTVLVDQWLRTLAAVVEDTGLVQGTHITTIWNSSFRIAHSLFSIQAQGMHMITHVQASTHT